MTTFADTILYSLTVAAVAGSLILLAGITLARIKRQSSHLGHQFLAGSIASVLLLFGIAVVTAPESPACIIEVCSATNDANPNQSFFSYTAAGKFSDLNTETHSLVVLRERSRLPLYVLLAWAIGFAVLTIRTTARHVRTWQLIRTSTPLADPALTRALHDTCRQLGVRSNIRLLQHPDVRVPVVGGIIHNVLFVPDDFVGRSTEQTRVVLLHELAHLKRHDAVIALMTDIAIALMWFNPFIWVASKRMHHLQELAADSTVLNAGIKPSRYARLLLDLFRDIAPQPSPLPVAHSIFGGCLVDTRLRDILDHTRVHRLPSRATTGIIATTFVMLSIGGAAVPDSLRASGLLHQEAAPGQLDTSLLNRHSLDSLLRPVFKNTMTDRYIAGAAISVVHRGELVYQQGFGHREVYYEQPVDPARTIFRIGSISKVMTGVAIMQLVDRGLIDLEADVNDYLTAFKVPDTYPEPVRVKHLLTHTAGFDQIGLGRHVRTAEQVRPLGDFLSEYLIRIRPPGTVSSYDTYAITLAGYLVEQISGQTYEQYLIENIFEPLEMHRSGITVPPALAGDAAVGYGFAGSWEAMRWEFMNTDPASTVNSTAADMARFATMMLAGGLYEGKRILSEQSARAMMTQQFTNHPDHPGYGWTFFEDRAYGVPAWSHGGSMNGFGSFLYLVPEHRLGVYFSYNQESGSLIRAVLPALMEALFPTPEIRTELRPRIEQPAVERFVGTYANNMYHHTDPNRGWRRRPFEITGEGDALLFEGSEAFQVGPLDFQRPDGVLLSFLENNAGEITHLVVNQTVYERLR